MDLLVVMPAADSPSVIAWGVASAPLEGDLSGDAYLIWNDAETALIAAIDGLGHGPEAAHAAKEAIGVLDQHLGEPVIALMQHCHQALLKTRGAALSLVWLDARAQTMSWVGVGNVEALMFRAGSTAREHLLLRRGVVGYQLPALRASTLPISQGDTIIMATDGIRTGFHEQYVPFHSPQWNADRIFAWGAKKTDDALVLVVEYRGPTP